MMNDFISKIWIFVVAVIVISLAIFVSFIFFIGAIILILISIPYIYYLKKKAEKEIEYYDVEYEITTKKQLEDGKGKDWKEDEYKRLFTKTSSICKWLYQ